MAHNPLHPTTGRRVWDSDTYAIREDKPTPNDKRWDPTLYGTGGNNAQILGREWDPALYETRTDASDGSSYAVSFEENQDPESTKAARTATVRK